jgi:hypothetical protein
MDEFLRPAGRFERTARLFERLAGLPRESRLRIFERLIGDRVATRLHQLVIEMSPESRQALHDELAAASEAESPVTTVMLDDDDALMRQKQRRDCRLKAIAVVGDRTFEALVTDISSVGLFLKAEGAYPTGAKIRISMRLPGPSKPLILRGVIVRGAPGGVAVRFEELAAEALRALAAYVSGTPL